LEPDARQQPQQLLRKPIKRFYFMSKAAAADGVRRVMRVAKAEVF
jgi:hypothetical protein